MATRRHLQLIQDNPSKNIEKKEVTTLYKYGLSLHLFAISNQSPQFRTRKRTQWQIIITLKQFGKSVWIGYKFTINKLNEYHKQRSYKKTDNFNTKQYTTAATHIYSSEIHEENSVCNSLTKKPWQQIE